MHAEHVSKKRKCSFTVKSITATRLASGFLGCGKEGRKRIHKEGWSGRVGKVYIEQVNWI